MLRRILIASASALVLFGAVSPRLLGQAQDPAPAPTRPADAPIPPAEGDGPAPLGSPSDDVPLLPVREPENRPKDKDTPAKKPVPRRADPQTDPAPAPPPAPTPAAPAPDPVAAPDAPEAGSPRRDEEVVPARADEGANPLAPAKDNPHAPAPSGPSADPMILPAERLAQGPSTASLTVEVQAPPNANLNKPLKFKIFVKNSGAAPAMGVTVQDRLPEGMDFVKSDPPAAQIGPVLRWQLDSLAAGAEKAITVTAIPRVEREFDHAATVSLRTGSKSRTLVKRPRLKVELTHDDTGPVLRGKGVRFAVRVSNVGTGPARGVLLHADLTSGLKHEAGSSLMVVFKDYLGKDTLAPGESESLDLDVDAVSGGDQSCKVFAESPDVEDAPEAHAEAHASVVEPKLELSLSGSGERYTDTVATYTLTVANSGTATARKVVAAAFLPDIGGELDQKPPGTTYTPETRRLYWPVGDLAKGEKKSLPFNVRLRGVGQFKVDASARAVDCPDLSDSRSTQVVGMPDVKCLVIAQTRVMDVGEEITYEVQLKNVGSKEASKLKVTATVTDNLEITLADGTDKEASSTRRDRHDCAFPPIDLAPKDTKTLTLRVKALKAGTAECTVAVEHDDFKTRTSTTTKVQEPK